MVDFMGTVRADRWMVRESPQPPPRDQIQVGCTIIIFDIGCSLLFPGPLIKVGADSAPFRVATSLPVPIKQTLRLCTARMWPPCNRSKSYQIHGAEPALSTNQRGS